MAAWNHQDTLLLTDVRCPAVMVPPELDAMAASRGAHMGHFSPGRVKSLQVSIPWASNPQFHTQQVLTQITIG